jgi:hypothetical protein
MTKRVSDVRRRKQKGYSRKWREAHPEQYKNNLRKWRRENRSRWNAYVRKYRKRNPDRFKNYDLKKRFGISVLDYCELLLKQQGVCAICLQPERRNGNGGRIKDLAVDHDHATGKVRGLLCCDCNTALGLLNEDPVRARALIDYIVRYRKEVQ